MKKQTKGIFFTVLFIGALMFSAAAASLPGIIPTDDDSDSESTMTGTPMDNIPDAQRPQFCSTGDAKYNKYVQEFKIPTPCTMPLAIETDPAGNVWFVETNTGNIAKYDPSQDLFTEFLNPNWPPNSRSMMWGIDYSADGTLWFTEDTFDSIWKYYIADNSYQRISFENTGDSLPQKIQVIGSKVLVNDFTGNKMTIIEAARDVEEIRYTIIPSPIENSVTGGFDVDSENNIWYTNWIFQSNGALVKFDQNKFLDETRTFQEESKIPTYVDVFQLPKDLSTPNGLSIGPDGRVWLADTSSSFFFAFDPLTEEFTKYITSTPRVSTYGNFSGLIKDPVSRPYWTAFDDSGRLVFNEQTANSIGIFSPQDESLIEYLIPSKNPNWADCGMLEDCGLSQIFGFTIDGEKIWFTEWVENNIGVIDTSIPLPLSIQLDTQNITIKKGEDAEINLILSPLETADVIITTTSTALFSDLVITPSTDSLILGSPQTTPISISAGVGALPATHKVLISVQAEDVTISQYITVTVVP